MIEKSDDMTVEDLIAILQKMNQKDKIAFMEFGRDGTKYQVAVIDDEEEPGVVRFYGDWLGIYGEVR